MNGGGRIREESLPESDESWILKWDEKERKQDVVTGNDGVGVRRYK